MSISDYDHLREPYTPKEDEFKWIADFAAAMGVSPEGAHTHTWIAGEIDPDMPPFTIELVFDEDKTTFHWLHIEDGVIELTCAECAAEWPQ